MSKSKNICVRMGENLYQNIKEIALKSGYSISMIIKKACEEYDNSNAMVSKCKKIIKETKLSDIQQIKFNDLSLSGSEMAVYFHRNAISDMLNFGKKCEDEIMEYIKSSIKAGNFISKCRVMTTDHTRVFHFKVNIFDVYGAFGVSQITILVVDK